MPGDGGLGVAQQLLGDRDDATTAVGLDLRGRAVVRPDHDLHERPLGERHAPAREVARQLELAPDELHRDVLRVHDALDQPRRPAVADRPLQLQHPPGPRRPCAALGVRRRGARPGSCDPHRPRLSHRRGRPVKRGEHPRVRRAGALRGGVDRVAPEVRGTRRRTLRQHPREPAPVAGLEQRARAAQHLGDRPRRARDDRRARGHRLDQHHPELLLPALGRQRGEHQRRGARVQRRHLVVGDRGAELQRRAPARPRSCAASRPRVRRRRSAAAGRGAAPRRCPAAAPRTPAARPGGPSPTPAAPLTARSRPRTARRRRSARGRSPAARPRPAPPARPRAAARQRARSVAARHRSTCGSTARR